MPKTADRPAADMRVLRLAKESAVKARTQAMNQLKAVLLALDPDLREQLTSLRNPALIDTCAAFDDDRSEAIFTMRLLARRVQNLSHEIKELTKRTTKAVRACRPQLLELVGVGPDSAAVLLSAAGDNPDRLTDEASFAALCGVSPVEQSSGKTQRRRLNRGGHRQANAALYRIVQSRIRWDERTQAYLQRRTTEGHVQARDHPLSQTLRRPGALPTHPASGDHHGSARCLTNHRGILNTHLAAGLKRYEAEHDWLTTVRLPAYAPDLNPVEAVWSLVRRAMANTAFDTPDDLDRTLRRELRRIQLRPHLINGCLTATGLTINPPTPP